MNSKSKRKRGTNDSIIEHDECHNHKNHGDGTHGRDRRMMDGDWIVWGVILRG